MTSIWRRNSLVWNSFGRLYIRRKTLSAVCHGGPSSFTVRPFHECELGSSTPRGLSRKRSPPEGRALAPVGRDGKLVVRIVARLPDRLGIGCWLPARCSSYSTFSTSLTSLRIPAFGSAPTASLGLSSMGMKSRLGMLWIPNTEATSVSSSTLTL